MPAAIEIKHKLTGEVLARVAAGCPIGAELSGANLAVADLNGMELTNAILRAANLAVAELRGAKLRGADLSEANFRVNGSQELSRRRGSSLDIL